MSSVVSVSCDEFRFAVFIAFCFIPVPINVHTDVESLLNVPILSAAFRSKAKRYKPCVVRSQAALERSMEPR